ncbi:hypothetical protein ACOME3_003265 [Neoechinorhynchus agilis]
MYAILCADRSFDLPNLCDHLLNEKRQFIQSNSIYCRMCFRASESLVQAIRTLRSDAISCLNLAAKLNILPLAYQITSICGNVLSRTLLGGRAERNEFLLLHAFDRAGFLLPEPSNDSTLRKDEDLIASYNQKDDEEDAEIYTSKPNHKKKIQMKHFAGGLVLEPKIGFYDTYILLLDFNSLYPSIIQEYNICFSTRRINDESTELSDLSAQKDVSRGVLPLEIQKLVQSRREVRKLMANRSGNQNLQNQYNIRQMALKLTANTALVTALGRDTLEKTKSLVESLGVEVIYGDTDSLMINTCSRDLEDVRKLGQKLKAEINRHYQQLEIDVDGVFKCLLLMKKKKYAGLLVDDIDARTGELLSREKFH